MQLPAVWLARVCGTHSFRVECPQLGTPPPPPSQEVKEAGKLSRKLSRSPPLRYPVVPSPSLPAGPSIRGHQLSTHWIKVLIGVTAISPKQPWERRKKILLPGQALTPGLGEGGRAGVSGAVSQARLHDLPESNRKHKQPS